MYVALFDIQLNKSLSYSTRGETKKINRIEHTNKKESQRRIAKVKRKLQPMETKSKLETEERILTSVGTPNPIQVN